MTLALPAASRGCRIDFAVRSYNRQHEPILVTRSGVVRSVRRDGIFDVATGDGLKFVAPSQVRAIRIPKEAN